MVFRLTFIQMVITEYGEAWTKTILVSVNVLTTGYTARTVKTGNDYRFEVPGGQNFPHLLRVLLDTLAISLDRAFPANASFGIRPSERYLYGYCLSQVNPLLI